jgi:hypothetical protein
MTGVDWRIQPADRLEEMNSISIGLPITPPTGRCSPNTPMIS